MRKQATASGRMRPQMGKRTYARDHIYFDGFRRNFVTSNFLCVTAQRINIVQIW